MPRNHEFRKNGCADLLIVSAFSGCHNVKSNALKPIWAAARLPPPSSASRRIRSPRKTNSSGMQGNTSKVIGRNQNCRKSRKLSVNRPPAKPIPKAATAYQQNHGPQFFQPEQGEAAKDLARFLQMAFMGCWSGVFRRFGRQSFTLWRAAGLAGISSAHLLHPESAGWVARKIRWAIPTPTGGEADRFGFARRLVPAEHGSRGLEHREQIPDFIVDFRLGGDGFGDGSA